MYKVLILIVIYFVVGCHSASQRRLEVIERKIDTDGRTSMLFHSALYYPDELSLRFDGYIVGVEKSPHGKVSHAEDIKVRALPDVGIDMHKVRETIVDKKILYVSHILLNNDKENDLKNCAIYNVYENISTNVEVKQLVDKCNDFSNPKIDTRDVYKSSWVALDRLEKSMRPRIDSGQYTDIVVVVMGWNTVQEEAVRNFNSIIKNLKKNSGDKFNPLVIGVTWPSQWQSDWLSPVYKLFSFPTKSDDADELGMTWLGVLLHQTIPNVNKRLPVTVIGHSFGARAASVASCVGPAIYRDTDDVKINRIDNLINMQGAFRTSRFFQGGVSDGINFTVKCKNVNNLVFTSSKHDKAVSMAFWRKNNFYVGDIRGYKKYCEGIKKPDVNCAVAAGNGLIKYVVTSESSNITYVDASELIFENAYLSGGGAHSDIYRKEHGQLMSHFIFKGR